MNSVVVLGNKGSGKTCFIEHFFNLVFLEEYKETTEVKSVTQEILIDSFDDDSDFFEDELTMIEIPDEKIRNNMDVIHECKCVIVLVDKSNLSPEYDPEKYTEIIQDKPFIIVTSKCDLYLSNDECVYSSRVGTGWIDISEFIRRHVV
jgi:GTPase SAR1 family protein